ncbi:hypothetical protein C0995_008285 [Termitomyces sp. Mi166|nr:hypothetical protein C0995_008285 [Termitomyces sp. Mi166\
MATVFACEALLNHDTSSPGSDHDGDINMASNIKATDDSIKSSVNCKNGTSTTSSGIPFPRKAADSTFSIEYHEIDCQPKMVLLPCARSTSFPTAMSTLQN